MSNQAEVNATEIRNILRNLEDVLQNEVIGGDMEIEDYVDQYFIPNVKKIEDSGVFVEDDETDIANMLDSISILKKGVRELSGTYTQEYFSKATILQGRVKRSLKTINKKFEGVKVEINETLITSTLSLAKEIGQDDIPELGFENYIYGPGRHYQIRSPPDNWKVTRTKLGDWVTDMFLMGAKERKLSKLLFREISSQDILLFQVSKERSLKPIMGRTLLQGRLIPSVLEVPTPTEFAIYPLDKYTPPLFIEQPFEHNFYNFLHSFIANSRLDRFREGINKEGRRYLLAELSQNYEHVIVDSREEQNVTVMVKIYGFEGVTEDYALFLHYPVVRGADEREIESNVRELFSLVHTFHPIKPDTSVVVAARAEADANFKKLLTDNGKDIFFQQLLMGMARISGLDINKTEDRKKILDVVKPFETFGNQMGINDEDWGEAGGVGWESFWDEFRRAQSGNDSEFFVILERMISNIQEELNEDAF